MAVENLARISYAADSPFVPVLSGRDTKLPSRHSFVTDLQLVVSP
jgi:hypothetical protein